jgi:methyl-accepting chemotaxis protein
MRITIKTKLSAAFGAILLITAGTAWLGVSNLGTLDTTMDDVLTGPVQRMEAAEHLSNALLLAVRAEKNLLLATQPAERERFDA